MWLLGQIIFYLLGAFAIGATGSWILRGRLADDSHEHLRQRFRQMVSSSEMERDAAKLRVRELSVEVRTLEEQLEQVREGGVPGASGDEGTAGAVATEPQTDAADSDPAEPADPSVGDISARDAPGVDEEDVAAAALTGAEVNGTLPEMDAAEAAPGDELPTDLGSTLPAPATTNGGGVSHRFELAETPGPGEPEDASQPQDTILPHTWASADPSATARQEGAGPPANGRPFSDLGDIAPATSEQLRSMGIHNTTDLHRHFRSGVSPSELARSLNVEVRKVRRWQVLSELMEVPQVGPESAWLLEISGLASVGELAAEDPGELASRMAALNADQGLGLPVPERDVVASWVQWASSSRSPQSAGP